MFAAPAKIEPVDVHSSVKKEGDNYTISSTVCGETTCSMFEVQITQYDLTHYKFDDPEAFCEALFKYLVEKQKIATNSLPNTITSAWLRSSHPSIQ